MASIALPDLGTRELRAIVAVYRYGNFAAAAADVGVSQPTLTRTVRRAEDALGAALFMRTTRRVALTPAGQEFLPLAERLLDDLGLGMRNIRELADVERGQIVIATQISIAQGVLPKAMRRFATRFPSVDVRLLEGVQSGVMEAVRGGVADFGLGDTTHVNDPLTAEPLGDQAFRVVLPKGHRLLRRKTITVKELDGETVIGMPPESSAWRMMEAAILSAGIEMPCRLTVGLYTTAFRLVAEGLGLILAPTMILSSVHPEGVASRPLASGEMIQHQGIIARRDREATPAAAAFMQVVRDVWPRSDEVASPA
jgi:DNA-binding transcriptional LysR family regulator